MIVKIIALMKNIYSLLVVKAYYKISKKAFPDLTLLTKLIPLSLPKTINRHNSKNIYANTTGIYFPAFPYLLNLIKTIWLNTRQRSLNILRYSQKHYIGRSPLPHYYLICSLLKAGSYVYCICMKEFVK